MSNFATITSKGTVSVPAKIRKELGVKPGMRVQFRMNERTGNVEIVRPVDIEDLQRRTREHLQAYFTPEQLKEMAKNYQSGDGFATYVKEKYGCKPGH
jgi:AbrB family looped-hinge helix DNA binding protein